MKRVAIITASDSSYQGLREDVSGPEIRKIIEEHDYQVVHYVILPDNQRRLEAEMKRLADEDDVDLILTTGGTGFSPRDCTPEATLNVIRREAPGIPEAMRYISLQKTKRAMLSRGVAGIRGKTLIVNLPGSPTAVRECLEYIVSELAHGLEVLQGEVKDCAAGRVLAICISKEKGVQKRAVKEAVLLENFGLEGDAHGGDWHRQVSLLSHDKIEAFRKQGAQVRDGDFGENIVVQGIDFSSLPVGTKLACNDVVLEIMQIGKVCHHRCQIYHAMGDCIMPREGVFAKVRKSGNIKVGDTLQIV